MMVENCSIAMTSATHHYMVKISSQIYYMSLPTAAGLFKMSSLRAMPPTVMVYVDPLWSGIVIEITSLEKPAVDMACTITAPNTAKKSNLKSTL